MPELPEVETMVRGLRPALVGRTICAGSRSTTRSCSRAARPRSSSAGRAGATVERVERRGKWVVIALGERPGDYRHPAADDGRLLAGRSRAARHIRLTFHLDEAASDGLVLRHPAAGQDRLVSPTPRRPSAPSRRSHGPDALEIAPRRAGRAAGADRPRDQADPDGPEGAGGDRQHLRRRDPLPAADPPRAAGVDALERRRSTGSTRRSARSWPRRSRRRGRASTPAIGRSSAWKAASWPRTPCTAGAASPARRAAGRSSRPRSPA